MWHHADIDGRPPSLFCQCCPDLGFSVAVWHRADIDRIPCSPPTQRRITRAQWGGELSCFRGHTIAVRHHAYIDCGPGGSGPNNDHAALHYACTLVYLPWTFFDVCVSTPCLLFLHLVEWTGQGVGFTIAVWHLACIDCGPEGLGP